MPNQASQPEQQPNPFVAEIQRLKDLLASGFAKADSNFESIKHELSVLHKKVDFLSKKVDLLESTTDEGLEDVGIKLENLTEEITKIGVVTKYDDQFQNLKGFN